MSGDKTDADFAELVAAGFPVGKGVPDGVDKTADWTSLEDMPVSSGVPDGLTQTADWTGLDAGFPSGGSGVPDGLTKTADWTGIDADFPVSSGVPDGVNKTADWTGIEAAPESAPVPPKPGQSPDWPGLSGTTVAKALETARSAKAVSRTLDFEDLPLVGSPTSGVPMGSGAPEGSNKTQDWTGMGDLPTGSGAPAGSNKTQDWTGIEDIPTGSGAPPGSRSTMDWTDMASLADDTTPPSRPAPAAGAGPDLRTRPAMSPLPQAALPNREKTDEEIAADANWDWDFLDD